MNNDASGIAAPKKIDNTGGTFTPRLAAYQAESAVSPIGT